MHSAPLRKSHFIVFYMRQRFNWRFDSLGHLYLCVGRRCRRVRPPSETQRNQACWTTARIWQRGLRWSWRGRCGGGSSCLKRPCKTRASRRGSPNTPPPCRYLSNTFTCLKDQNISSTKTLHPSGGNKDKMHHSVNYSKDKEISAAKLIRKWNVFDFSRNSIFNLLILKKVTSNRLPILKTLRRIFSISAIVGKDVERWNVQSVRDPGPLCLMQMYESSPRLKCLLKLLCAGCLYKSSSQCDSWKYWYRFWNLFFPARSKPPLCWSNLRTFQKSQFSSCLLKKKKKKNRFRELYWKSGCMLFLQTNNKTIRMYYLVLIYALHVCMHVLNI